jgi:hypothetical protein
MSTETFDAPRNTGEIVQKYGKNAVFMAICKMNNEIIYCGDGGSLPVDLAASLRLDEDLVNFGLEVLERFSEIRRAVAVDELGKKAMTPIYFTDKDMTRRTKNWNAFLTQSMNRWLK